MLQYFLDLVFPPKCLFCQTILGKGEVDLCPNCRIDAPVFINSKNKHSFIARWTCVWYYKDNARSSILRYKFYNRRSYAQNFGRFLAVKLQQEDMDSFDLLTWVPVATLRRLKRGFDQVELLAHAVGKELNVKPQRTLKKIRNTPPQSKLTDPSHRRANILGAYRVINPELVANKRILLLDDVITSGATASECAKMLMTAGAKEVLFAAIATAEQK